jgi:hypothetical protein
VHSQARNKARNSIVKASNDSTPLTDSVRDFILKIGWFGETAL